jgi:hypothetical protein
MPLFQIYILKINHKKFILVKKSPPKKAGSFIKGVFSE